MSTLEPRIIATAGHIDHGKSTLVEALTGTDPDRLPEERKRGMTIELGFANLVLEDAQRPGCGWSVGIVDVPGHADFVRNMVAGVGQADAAMLVVAADDGWMPQTEEHFEILLYFGVTRGVVALTKSDLLTERSQAEEHIRARLADTPWEKTPVVPVCALGGDGLDDLRQALANVLRHAPPPADIEKPRLHVDRVFSPRGVGTVVTGTLSGGRLRAGQDIFVQPGCLAGKIRGLQNHNKSLDAARPGMRTAVQLGGIDIARDGVGTGVWRGHTVASGEPGSDGASGVMHVSLHRLERSMEAPLLRHGRKVWLHHGTSSHEARVYLAGDRELAPGESRIGELRTRTPVFAFTGDRFVLRDISRRHSLAGGIVLETSARPRAWKQPAHLHALQQRAAHPDDAGVWVRGLLERDSGFRTDGLFLRSGFAETTIAKALASLPDKVAAGPWIISHSRWRAALDAAAEAIHAHHCKASDEPGLKLSDLRAGLQRYLPAPELFEPLVDALVKERFVRGQGIIRAADFTAQLSPAQRAACDKLRAVLDADKYSPPKLTTFIQTPDDQMALQSLLRTGEVFRLNAETVMLTGAYQVLKQLVIAHFRSHGRDTVAGLRDGVGGSRRILVPLCEQLDREHITVRSGDWRSLNPKGTATL